MSHVGNKIIYKTPQQIENLRISGKYLTEMLTMLRSEAKEGVSLLEIEAKAVEFVKKNTIKGSFVGHQGYKHILCLSVNNCLVHGIPDNYILKKGDLLKIDAGITYKGCITDSAVALVVGGGTTNPKAQKLLEVTKGALDLGLQHIKPGKSLYNYGYTVEQYIKINGCTVLKNLTGHGVGTSLWEPPYIYNYANPNLHDVILKPNMVIALEPITAMGSVDYIEKPSINNWNLYTRQGDLGCQWEYTVLITENGYEILSGVEEIA